MKIALFTNTYLPHVGGVARSVKTLEDACRQRGHEVLVIAPEFKEALPSPHVLRVPAIQNFNGSDFSVQLPAPGVIKEAMAAFEPDLIHSHHPFLLGDAALREARKRHVPLVFTHHTLYERYTHYVPLDSPALKRAAIQLATEYCNMCDHVVAPSRSIRTLLNDRGVTTPVATIPTGIDVPFFARGNGQRFRAAAGIPQDARVIGHTGRLAREKNLLFLAEAVATCLNRDPRAVFLVIGNGEAREEMLDLIAATTDRHRVHAPGVHTGSSLADAYAAMDWFAFASQTETQGLVLAEAMATGTPVVAVDAPGVREIVVDRHNGLLLHPHATTAEFANALSQMMEDTTLTHQCAAQARLTALEYDTARCAAAMLECYEQTIAQHPALKRDDMTPWDRLLESLDIEWSLFREKVSAAAAAVGETPATEARLD
jgi:glycosyltransferase involved in cell wall biosynthesis